MDELDISGKRFISSKRAAKENRYHVDYIGQLIRSGKVVGSKVGRTWYVDAESLATYLGKEYKAPEKAAAPAPTYQEPQKIEHQSFTYSAHASTPTAVQRAPKLTYLSDDEPLAPAREEIRKVEIHIPEEKQKQEEKNPWGEEVHPLIPRQVVGQSRAALMVTAGFIAFLGALGASALLSYTNTVAGAENTASVTFMHTGSN